MPTVNWLAVLVSALSTLLIGGLWYSPAAFGNAWMKENGFTEESMKGANMTKIFGLAFLLGVIASVNLAMFLGPDPAMNAGMGAFYGFLAGFGWVATFIGTHYLFERKSFKLFLINAGCSILTLTVMGAIIGAWR